MIAGWGDEQGARIARVLAWVTTSTNLALLRKHIRPEGVVQLALRRQLEAAHAQRESLDAAQLRAELETTQRTVSEQDEYFRELAEENGRLEASISETECRIEELEGTVTQQEHALRALKEHLGRAGETQEAVLEPEMVLDMLCRPAPPSPLECLDLVERTHPAACIVLDSARASARQMERFVEGRALLELLRRLAGPYRNALMENGDSVARTIFGRKEYAAKESETVMANRAMRRQRTFRYEGEEIEMFRHLKIGVDDDVTRTIRVHFH